MEDENEVDIKAPAKQGTLFEAIGDGALDGGRVALIVAAMLVSVRWVF